MWSLGQQTCTVTVALLPRLGTVTLQEAGGTAQSRGACLLPERFHLLSSDPAGGSECPLHQLAWSQALLRGELQTENLNFLGVVVCVSEPALLVWSVFGEGDSTVCCKVEARVLLAARFYQ